MSSATGKSRLRAHIAIMALDHCRPLPEATLDTFQSGRPAGGPDAHAPGPTGNTDQLIWMLCSSRRTVDVPEPYSSRLACANATPGWNGRWVGVTGTLI